MDRYREEWGCWWKDYLTYISELPTPVYQPQILFRIPISAANFANYRPTIIGYKCKVASLKRRMMAEFIDFQILMVVKYVMFMMLAEEQQEFVKLFLLDDDTDTDISLDELLDFFTYLFAYWAIVLLYESTLLAYSKDGLGGATVGKRIMGIKVIRATSVTHNPGGVVVAPGVTPEHTVTVAPGSDIGFWRAISRTAFKDLTTTIFFPVFFTMLYSRNGQSFYDITTGTIVVHKNSQPVYATS